MNNQLAGMGRARESTVIGALLLASILGHSAVAQTPASPAVSPPALPVSTHVPASTQAPGSTHVPGSAQDIREIRGPKPITAAWLIPVIALSTLLSGAGAWAAWIWYRGRPRLYLQTPFEIALARFKYARELMQPELGREFSIEVSRIVREYIERRFRVMAAHLTTYEFLHDSLSSADPLLAASRPLLAEFMESCDLAKFGGWRLSIRDMETMLHNARRFVVESAAAPARADLAADPTMASVKGTTTASANPAVSAAATAPSITPGQPYDSIPST